MLISDSHRFILYLPQKCATNTLSERLREYRHEPECGSAGYFEPRLGRILCQHVNQAEAHAAGYLEGREDYFKAAFVRNPYDRIYSWFRWSQNAARERYRPGGLIDQARQAVVAGDDTDGCKAAFLKHTESMRDALAAAKGDVNRFYSANPKQYSLASDFTHHEGQQAVDWIGHVECFERDFDAFCERVGIKVENRKSANQSDADPKERSVADALAMSPEDHDYLEFFNRTNINRINRAFAADFNLLGYRRHRRGFFSGFRS